MGEVAEIASLKQTKAQSVQEYEAGPHKGPNGIRWVEVRGRGARHAAAALTPLSTHNCKPAS